MLVRSVSPRDLPVTTRKTGQRVALTVKPGEEIDLPISEAISICKNGPFVPADDEAKKMLESTMPVIEDVKVRRKATGTEKMAEDDLEQQKKVLRGGK